MSWISDLYETYENTFDMEKLDISTNQTPVPILHIIQEAQIEITLDQRGNFIHAEAIEDKDNSATIIPVSLGSAARARDLCAHPLEDKLEYIAGDFEKYTGKNNELKHRLYIKEISQWCNSPYSCKEVQAIKNYTSQGHVMRDLITCGVLKSDSNKNGMLSKDKIASRDQQECLVRFSVSGGEPDAVYRNKRIFDLYIKYYYSLGGEQELCCVKGAYSVCSQKHAAKIRSGGDKAKLISANDDSGFTYRGRFSEPTQAVTIGYDVSQKAHSALRWLVKKNGFSVDDMTVVSWEMSGKEIPKIMYGNTVDLFSIGAENDSYEDNIGTMYAMKLKRAVNGYRQDLGNNSNIVVMGLEAATPGRLSVCFYNKMRGSDFIDNIENWYSTCCWRWNENIGTPSLKQIAAASCGVQNTKLWRHTVKRLLPCVTESQSVPGDIVRRAVNAASNPESFQKKWEWEQAIGIACALIKKQQYDCINDNGGNRKEWSMDLDIRETDRSYLFGRLVASAQKVEEMALYIAGAEVRTTAAERYFMQIQEKPARTWKIIVNCLHPYIARLKNTGAYKYVEEMNAICATIATEDFIKNDRLSEIFMLGYSCQFNKYKDEKNRKKERKQDDK